MEGLNHTINNSNTSAYLAGIFNASNRSIVNYTFLSDNLNNIKLLDEVRQAMNLIFPENNITNKKSGLDLFAKDKDNGKYKYIESEVNMSTYKYYTQWKDTAFINGYQAFQLRIRWAKSSYDSKIDDPRGSYFNVPVDQLREFPGFVYHCHILPH